MTEQTQPTDAEILDAADDFRSQYKHGGTTFDEFDALGFARAVLAKWGTPAGAGEVVAWLSTDSIGERYLCFTKPKDTDPARPLVFGDTTTQPTQAQAGAVPLTDEQIDGITSDNNLDSIHAVVRYVERLHGIKGADHG